MPDEARDWEQVRADAIAAFRNAMDPCVRWPDSDVEAVVDAILAVCDEEAVNRAADDLISKSYLRSLDVRDGAAHLEAIPAQEVIAAWALAARGMLDGTGAANYTETSMEFPDRARGERYVFILQRVGPGKLTPHEARKRAEAEVERLSAEVTSLREQLEAARA